MFGKRRLRINIRGVVQGVGFRPFIYRLATEMGLQGWVNNTSSGVFIEVEGSQQKLEEFLLRIEKEKPTISFIQSLEYSYLDPVNFTRFEIISSDSTGEKSALILPDIATCSQCKDEIFDKSNRRYLYPFTNCTNCGPRFSIIEALPYDRPNTTMKIFKMCEQCEKEYNDPQNRRFHAQPNACARCGPHIELWDKNGKFLSKYHTALLETAELIREGKIVAIKGLGGFHLVVDARNEEAVSNLRQKKHREEKPFAIMCPSIEYVEQICEVSPLEKRLLSSPESPIVLLKRKSSTIDNNFFVAPNIAPNNPYLGIMLPYTPLHHILMEELKFPIVATSGNISDEPICTDEYEALKRLGNIAEFFLVHNRPIKRHIDDSIVRIILGRELVLRRARGYAPLPIHLNIELPPSLAVGAHLKNTVAITSGKNIFISQHIGDLETNESFNAFKKVIESLKNLYETKPEVIICDAHPDYLSTKFAKETGIKVKQVQHHYAHILSCIAENDISPPCLGVAWDGTGFGTDNTIWGGEFLKINKNYSYQRVAHFKQFHLPGSEKAIKEPRRVAFALLFEVFGDNVFKMKYLPPFQSLTEMEMNLLKESIKKNINSPLTSSAGRLFDGISSLIGLKQNNRFEGQAAMELEFSIGEVNTTAIYNFNINTLNFPFIIDWTPIIYEILDDMQKHTPVPQISAKFHNTLVEIIIAVAKLINEEKVVISGGCFQNKYLTENIIKRLQKERFKPYWHQRIPPNDGGISAGQIMALLAKI